MKKLTLILTFLVAGMTFTFGQIATDTIYAKKVFGGYQFYQGETRLGMNQLVNVMKPNEQAYAQIKSAQSNYTLATVFGAAGGFMIGWPIGTAVGGGEPNWVMAGIGAGLVIISIPITQSSNKKAIQAVRIYNSGMLSSSFWDNHELKFSMTPHGVGLSLRF